MTHAIVSNNPVGCVLARTRPIAGPRRACKHAPYGLDHTSPKRKRGKSQLFPRLLFGLVLKRSPLSNMLVGLLLIVGCTPSTDDRPADGRLPVFAGIPPLAYLVEQIGGEHVQVDLLVQPGQDPHTFEPTPRQVLALGHAKTFFKIDMPFENVLLEKVRENNRRLEIVDATAGVKKRWMDVACCEETAGHNHEHESPARQGGPTGEPDPHVWLSPRLLKTLARNVAAALCRTDPPHKADYERNLAALLGRLDALDQRIGHRLAPYRGRSFYVFHPGFGYFADAYGLHEEAIEAGGRTPKPKQLRALIERAKAEGVTTVFVQPQHAPESAQAVADALGGRVVTIDGLGQDVIADIEDIAAKVESAMRPAVPQGRNANTEGGRERGEGRGENVLLSSFVLRISFVIRHSSFVLPPSPFSLPPSFQEPHILLGGQIRAR
jgi:zinc transport system substrate-binding protein